MSHESTVEKVKEAAKALLEDGFVCQGRYFCHVAQMIEQGVFTPIAQSAREEEAQS